MNRFAVNITVLTVLLVGGGIYAYQAGVKDGGAHHAGAEHEVGTEHGTGAEAHGDQGLPTPEESKEDTAEGAQTTGDHTEDAARATEGTVESPEEDRTGEFSGSEQSKPDTGPQTAEGTQNEDDEQARVDQDNSIVTTQVASGNADQGKALFATSCAGCHGANAEGGFGPQLTGKINKWTVEQFEVALREGKTPEGKVLESSMPRFGKDQLSDVQLNDLHAFLSSQ